MAMGGGRRGGGSEEGLRAGREQRTRDVYYTQRLRQPSDRSHVRSATGWLVASIAAGAASALLLWMMFSAVEWGVMALLHPREGFTLAQAMLWFHVWKVVLCLGVGAGAHLAIYIPMERVVDTQNRKYADDDLGVHADDQHILTPEEVIAGFQPFPDSGAHSSVTANGLVSHIMISPKGLKSVDQTVFWRKDELDADGAVVAWKGEPKRDDDGRVLTRRRPIIDKDYADRLWDASGLPRRRELRRRFDATAIPYCAEIPDREKAGKGRYRTMADEINGDWTYPSYERQRPAGAYLVDHRPVNTLMLAITRAGKGQTYIEPMIDIWSREEEKRNIVVNDPKGELMFKFFVALLVRGYDVRSFNLSTPLKTDIYNPIWMAADAARRGDMQRCASYIQAIATVFFPAEGQDDPMWPNAAANAFSRCCYGLIDYYMEEEAELTEQARREGRSRADLADELDQMWGHVTLYNCYQFFVVLAGKTMPNPLNDLSARIKAGEFDENDPEQKAELDRLAEEAETKAVLWDNQPSQDMFTLYFNATRMLWQNSIRKLLGAADSSLRAMAGSDKTIASVYGITLTAMNFFTDPTISALTSGRPSQTLDLAGLSFPRRIGVRLAVHFIQDRGYVGMQCRWQGYSDPLFQDSMGPDFSHEDTIGRQGWATMLFKGIMPGERMYLKMDIYSPATGLELDHFWFRFDKGYLHTYDGMRFETDPVEHRRIVAGGTLTELVRRERRKGGGPRFEYVKGTATFEDRATVIEPNGQSAVDSLEQDCIVQQSVSYTEKPKAIFFITPPHLKMYAKLILILVKQLFDLSVETSYTAKESQKPLYKTSYMLDEFGNLESEGHGVTDLATMLSIGLGQDQQFTLILQTLQQLKRLYKDQEDIIRGNTANIVFLKSNDIDMIDSLSKASGATHRVYNSSESFQEENRNLTSIGRVQSSISTTRQAEQEQLLTVNDFLYLPERNSIVMQAGQPPIWNHNETILPMSYALLGDPIINPGHPYTMQTLPTLSSAAQFDVRTNQPDFFAMFDKRMNQALVAEDARSQFQSNYGYDDNAMSKLDADQAGTEIMAIVRAMVAARADRDFDTEDMDEDDLEDNDEFLAAAEQSAEESDDMSVKKFAEGLISPDMLVESIGGSVRVLRGLANEMGIAYIAAKADLMGDRVHFSVQGGDLCSAEPGPDGRPVVYVQGRDTSRDYRDLADRGVLHGDRGDAPDVEYTVTDDFIRFLAAQDSWVPLGGHGEFDRAMARVFRAREDQTILGSDAG